MTSTASPILRLELMGAGDQPGSWGTTTNTNLGTLVEAAVAGYVAVPIVAVNQALTIVNYAPDESRRAILKFTGGSANSSIYAPPVSKTYVLWNATSYTLTIYNSTVAGNTTAAGSGVAITAGEKVTVFSDGTSFYGTIPADTVTAARGGTGLTAPGATGNVLTSNGTAWTSAAPATQTPTGALLMWPTAAAPAGWLLCDGTSYSTATYASLFAVLNYTYGGSGANFNVPDFRDRMPIGAGSLYSANSQGGSKDVTSVFAHTHTATDSGHTHNVTGNLQGSAVLGAPSGGNVFEGATVATTTGNANITVASTGSSGINDNLPPYRGIYFIIKT